MLEIDINILCILTAVAFVAGFIDSIAGGGGIITIPALLLAGIPPHQALGTNKLQACFGSFSATLHFYKKGHIQLQENYLSIIVVFICASLGSILVRIFQADILAKCIPLLLIVFCLYFLFAPKITHETKQNPSHKALLLLVIGGIGFYDGFFGPGTGSFLFVALLMLGGLHMSESLARAKLYNCTSNIAALIIFASGGEVLWIVGLCMGIGQFIGGNLGSRVALRHGIKIIKPLIVLVCVATCAKLLYQQYF